jgi:hypothetical protein
VLAVAQQPVVVAVGETSKTSKGGKVRAEEADDDIEVVDAPPDTVDVY